MPNYEQTEHDGYWSDLRPKAHPQYGRAKQQGPSHWSKLPPMQHNTEETLKSGHVDVERKTFVFRLKENNRGRLLRITEEGNGKRSSLIVPATGLREFADLFQKMLDALPPE